MWSEDEWEKVQKMKEREEAKTRKIVELMSAVEAEQNSVEMEGLRREVEVREEEERHDEVRRFQEQLRALQLEKDNLAAELARNKQLLRNQCQTLSYSRSDYEAMKKTIYGHAYREPKNAQMGVAFVILNRAKANQSDWGGTSINAVCRKRHQFWLGIFGEPYIENMEMYNSIDEWLPEVLNGSISDLTMGADHFLPKRDEKDWLTRVTQVASEGSFNFYKAKWLP